MTHGVSIVLAIIFGGIFGSFFNVVIYRLPRKESIVSPPSRCPHCHTQIKPWDNIPILSFLFLRGKCRQCGAPISWRYPLIEMVSAVLAGLLVWQFGVNWITLQILTFIYLVGIAALIDFQHHIIPDGLTFTGIGLGILLSFFRYFPSWDGLNIAIFGAIVGGGVLYLIALFGNLVFKQESMGGGDIKFAAMMGVFLGWKLVLLGLFLGFCAGAILGIPAVIKSRLITREQQDVEAGEESSETGQHIFTEIPFGPALAVGGVASIIWGSVILQWYFGTFF